MQRGLLLSLLSLPLLLVTTEAGSRFNNGTSIREKRAFSLFSVVQFPNDICTTQVGSTIYGTCLTSSECTTASGTASGNCAAGFGVCCYIATSTCSSTISYNNTYLQNPTYPSSYTPTSATSATCTYTINKVNSNICQLRLDFQTFSGFSYSSTAGTIGVCTDFITVKGQTGYNPPVLCGTQTGYHMYAEFGADTADTATIAFTYASIAPAKQFNVFVRQIECTAPWRAPVDCTQYYTGTSGSIISYGWAGAQLIAAMDYEFCIRREVGYCSVSYTQTIGTTIDSFEMQVAILVTIAESTTATCNTAAVLVIIPRTSNDGITGYPEQVANGATGLEPFPNTFCGGFFGTLGADAVGERLTTYSFTGHVLSTGTLGVGTGFSLDYSQNACSL